MQLKESLKTISDLRNTGKTWGAIAKKIGFKGGGKKLRNHYFGGIKQIQVNALFIDIETAPIEAYTWGTFDQNVGLNQIKKDWHLLSFAAKWLGETKMIYFDQRKEKDVSNDFALAKHAWDLLNKADVVITQNGQKFDVKKLYARFFKHKLPPPKPFRQIDTYRLAKKHFGFTSNRLEYMAAEFCTKHKKSKHREFPGFELWKECLAGNKKAWREMEIYNKDDVTALEELYYRMIPFDNSINFNVYSPDIENQCPSCGGIDFIRKNYAFTNAGKYQRYKCKEPSCGKWFQSKTNLLSGLKRKGMFK